MRRSDREKSGRSSLQITRTAMSPAKPLDVVILPKALDDSAGGPGEPYQEFGQKLKPSGDDWSCYILAKEGEVSVIGAASTLRTHAFPSSYSRLDVGILRTSTSRFGSPLIPVTSNNTSSARRVKRETQ